MKRYVVALALGVLHTPRIVSRTAALSARRGDSRCNMPARCWLPVLAMCVCVSAVVGSVPVVSAQNSEQPAAESGRGDPAKEPDQTKAARRNMQVSVVDSDGKPLIGAKVHVSVWTKEPGYGNRDFVCDDDGKTKFELPKQIQILRLWASHKGHVGMFAQWWPEQEAKPREIPTEYTFGLVAGSKVGGIVRNEEGEPIVGAKVGVRLVGFHGEGEAAELAMRAIPNMWLAEGDGAIKTDVEGRWSLDNVPPGDTEVLVMLGHPDYISESKWGGLQKEQEITMRSLRDGSATIVMERGVSVIGVVTDQDKKPVAGAIIVQGIDPYFESGSQEVRTDAEGKYRLPPQPVGPLVVSVVAEGWSPDQRKLDSAAANPTANFQLKPGKTTQIRFIDDSGSAIPKVSVGIHGWRGNNALYNAVHPNVLNTKIPNQADADGVFQWTWSPGDVVSYTFYKEGYSEARLAAGEGEHVVKMRKD